MQKQKQILAIINAKQKTNTWAQNNCRKEHF